MTNAQIARLTIAFATVLGSATTSLADFVTVGFTGQVTEIEDISGLLTGKISVLDTFTGSFTYDASTLGTDVGGGVFTYSLSSSLGNSFSVAINLASFSTDATFDIEIGNNISGVGDSFLISQSPIFTEIEVDAAFMQILLVEATGTLFSTSALPSSLDLSTFSSGEFLITGATEEEDFTLKGELNLSSPMAVIPEPSSLALSGVGAVFSILWGWRRRGKPTK